MPRHSPCALISLTYFDHSNSSWSNNWFSSYKELCRLYQRSSLAKIVFYPKKIYPLLLPSHNCIIIHNVQFSRYMSSFKETQWNLSYYRNFIQFLLKESGGPRTRFPAGKPRRLQQSTGLLPRAAFRVHFGSLAFRTLLLQSWPRS